jgi:hypothetical protein
MGCQQSGDDGITVMFSGRPNVWDESVYHRGSVVGHLVSLETSGANISKAIIAMDGPYKDRLATNTVFYVSDGRINLGKVGNHGEAVKPDSAMAGFGSQGAYRWYKFKHILNNTVADAGKRAQYLMENF